MNMKAKLFTLLFAVVASVGTLFADGGRFGVDGQLTWDYTDGVLTITGNGAMDTWWESGDAPWDYLSSHIIRLDISFSVTTIAPNAFVDCYKLPEVNLPRCATSIGEGAFFSCSGMQTLTIEGAVDTIATYAFAWCNGLTAIICKGNTPPHCHQEAFHGVDRSTPIYVPEKSVDTYKAADVWKEFTNIQADNNLDIHNTSVHPSSAVRKQLRNGQVSIQRGNRTYSIFGQEIAE